MLICPKCEVEFRPAKIGVGVETMTRYGPYELLAADLLQCPGCRIQVAHAQDLVIVRKSESHYKQLRSGFTRILRAWKNTREQDAFRKLTEKEVTR